MGVKALKSHSQCQNHQKLLKEQSNIPSFFTKKGKASSKVVDVQVNHDQQSNQYEESSSGSTNLQTTILLSYQDGGRSNAGN